MKACRLAGAGVLAIAAAAAATGMGSQAIVPDQSEVSYVATQMGVPVEGSFARFSAHVDLDPARLQSGSVTFSVDTASVDFPSTDVVRELAKPDWFDSTHFPVAQFQSNSIRALPERDHFEIGGTLTIKGHAHAVVVPVSLSQAGANTLATGSLTIRRLDYGVGAGEWGDTSVVADQVQIKFKIALRPAPG